MSENETQNYVSLLATLIVSIPYFTYVITEYSVNNGTFSGNQELNFWASAILLLIPLRIIAQIIFFIFFMILRAITTGQESDLSNNDERDKLIELKGDRIATNTFAFGVIVAMLAVYFLSGGLAEMFLIMIFSGFIGEIISIFSKIYFYKSGIN